jgi:hypothetical protein
VIDRNHRRSERILYQRLGRRPLGGAAEALLRGVGLLVVGAGAANPSRRCLGDRCVCICCTMPTVRADRPAGALIPS